MKQTERELIHNAISAIGRCVNNHDMQTAMILIRFCKLIAGNDFQIFIEKSENDQN